MRKIALLIVTIAALAVVSVFMSAPAQAQTDIEGILDCPYADAAYYQPGVFPRYEAPGQRVMLVSWLTGEDVQVLDTGVNVAAFFGQSWSPDCRYLAVSMGTLDSLDTVVYDVAENRRVGRVPDAHQQPHHVTWGPDSYLVVETRIGGVLWQMTANSQHVLTTAWNTTTHRNFSRLRWDAANGQLIANLAVGGRVVYDLATALEVPEAENVTLDPRLPSDGVVYGRVVLGGRSYPCQSSYTYGYRNWFTDRNVVVPGIYPEYDFTNHAVYLALDGEKREGEVIEMVEANVITDRFDFRSWAPGCRYFAASLGVPGEDATDTIVWDVVTNTRVGAFEDARQIEHPIYWSPTGDALVVVTRDGTYLWHLPTNTPHLLTTAVETALDGPSGLRGFNDLQWNAETGLVLIVPVNELGSVYAYRIATGQRVDVYPADDGRVPADLLPVPEPAATRL